MPIHLGWAFLFYILCMGYEALANYDFYLKFQDKALEKVGQPCTIFVPKQQVTLGFEDLGKWVEAWTGVTNISNSFTAFHANVWIEFQIKRGAYYHFNLDPNDEENKQLVQAFLPTNAIVREGSFLRTSVGGNVSIWGDHTFAVVKIVDEGAMKTLKRTYFLRPVVSAELNQLLDVGSVK